MAAIYRGRAGCPGCSEAVARMLASDPTRTWRVEYVGEGEALKVTAATLAGADLYVQPGGNGSISTAWPALGATGQAAMKQYVEGGGHYLGICMGGFLAGRFGAIGWGWLPDVRTYPGAEDGTVVPTTWDGVGARKVWWEGGSSFGESRPGTQVLGRYADGEAAAVVAPAGSGAAAGIGPHVEADRSWYSAAAAGDTDGYDADLGIRVVNALMRR